MRPPTRLLDLLTPALWMTVGGGIGYVAGRFGGQAIAWELKKEFDVVDVVALLVTLAIALYVEQYVVGRSAWAKEQRGSIAELLIGLDAVLRELQRAVRRSARPDVDDIMDALRNLYLSLKLLRDAVESTPHVTCDFPAVERSIRRYKEALTMTDYPWQPLDMKTAGVIENAYGEALLVIGRVRRSLAA